jgi:hypothetical protein
MTMQHKNKRLKQRFLNMIVAQLVKLYFVLYDTAKSIIMFTRVTTPLVGRLNLVHIICRMLSSVLPYHPHIDVRVFPVVSFFMFVD